MELYINVETYKDIESNKTRKSYCIFSSKKSALTNAKTWINSEYFQERQRKMLWELKNVKTYITEDDCALGFYLTQIETIINKIDERARLINEESI